MRVNADVGSGKWQVLHEGGSLFYEVVFLERTRRGGYMQFDRRYLYREDAQERVDWLNEHVPRGRFRGGRTASWLSAPIFN